MTHDEALAGLPWSTAALLDAPEPLAGAVEAVAALLGSPDDPFLLSVEPWRDAWGPWAEAVHVLTHRLFCDAETPLAEAKVRVLDALLDYARLAAREVDAWERGETVVLVGWRLVPRLVMVWSGGKA